MSPLVRELDTPPARSRRSLLGAVGSGVTLAASGLLLPESVVAETAEVDRPVGYVQNRAGKRRHRRKKRRHKHDTQAYTTAVLTGPHVIPSDALTTFGFDTFLTIRNLTYDSSESRVFILESGIYSVDGFLTWSSSSAGTWKSRLVVTRAGLSSDAFVYTGILTTEPRPTVFTTNLRLEEGDSLQVVVQQNSATQALVSAGAIVITLAG